MKSMRIRDGPERAGKANRQNRAREPEASRGETGSFSSVTEKST